MLFDIQFFGGGGTSSGVSKRKGGVKSGSKTEQKTSEKSAVYHLYNNDREISIEERNSMFAEIIQRATAGTEIEVKSRAGRYYDNTYEIYSTKSSGKLRIKKQNKKHTLYLR